MNTILENDVRERLQCALRQILEHPGRYRHPVISFPLRYLPPILRDVAAEGIPDQEYPDDGPIRPLRTLGQVFVYLDNGSGHWGLCAHYVRDRKDPGVTYHPLDFHVGNDHTVVYENVTPENV